MKKFILGLAVTAFLGCGESRNQLMTRLTNEKKSIQDSLSIESMKVEDFKYKAYSNLDSIAARPFKDSLSKYYIQVHFLKVKLEKINFSIDSLSKMK